MKRRIAQAYLKAAARLRETSLRNISIVIIFHRRILKIINYILPNFAEESQWIEYENSDLYINSDDTVSNALFSSGTFEPLVRKKLVECLSPGDVSVDVGGHIGHHTVTMRKSVGDKGTVFVFEPHPENAKNIRRTIVRNNWRNVYVYRKGLANKNKKAMLTGHKHNTGVYSIREDAGKNSYEVDITKFSDFFAESDTDRIDLVKIDIEGAESDVIYDMKNKNILTNIESIILEVHTDYLSEEELTDMYNMLSSEGTLQTLCGDRIKSQGKFMNIEHSTHIIWSKV